MTDPQLARLRAAVEQKRKDMERPFDAVFQETMAYATMDLCRETNALLGYTQSDEISLLWYADDPKSQVWFDGRVAKMTSQCAALATMFFYRLLGASDLCRLCDLQPTFDARVWVVPGMQDAIDYFIWREADCTRNSVHMAASALYSHKELHGKSVPDMHEMLHTKGVNWNDYPEHSRRGCYVQRRTAGRRFAAEEIGNLPAKHAARSNPDLEIERTYYAKTGMPPLARVLNKVGVIFNGQLPLRMNDVE